MIKINKKRNLSDGTSNKKGRFNYLPKIPTAPEKFGFTVACKTGHIKSVQVFTAEILGQGAFKICFKAELIGGKQAKKKKIKAFLQELQPDNFRPGKQLLANLQFSVFLRNEAEKHGRKDLFIKVRPVMKNNSERVVGLMEQLARNTLLFEIQTTLTFQKINFIKDLLLAGEIMENAGVFHRDLKPENIFIVNGSVCIGDFDFTTQENTQTTVAGTYGYLPPELLSHQPGKEYDLKLVKQDPYAMGMIILQLLLNKSLINSATPFIAKDQLNLHLNDLEYVCSDNPQLVKITKGLLNFNAGERLTLVKAKEILSKR